MTPAPTTTASTSSTAFSDPGPHFRRKPEPTYPVPRRLNSGPRHPRDVCIREMSPSFRGAAERRTRNLHFRRPVFVGSGLAAMRRPGMTRYYAKLRHAGLRCLLGEKPVQRLECRLGRLFRDEMAAADGLAGDVFGVVAPHRKHVVAAALAAAFAPQNEERHAQLFAAVGPVVFEVDRCAGAVFVAGRADRFRVAEAA